MQKSIQAFSIFGQQQLKEIDQLRVFFYITELDIMRVPSGEPKNNVWNLARSFPTLLYFSQLRRYIFSV